MNILAIESATQFLSIALKCGNSVWEQTMNQGFKHSENIMPLVDSLVKNANIKPNEIDLVVTSRGPGSFTGLRIGMATSKGIATGANAGFITVPTLEIYSEGFEYFDGIVVPVIDAKKGCFYCQLFESGKAISEALDITIENLSELIPNDRKLLLTGPDANKASEQLKIDFKLDKNFAFGKATILLEKGLECFNKNGSDSLETGPTYLRKSEAELSLLGE